MHEQVSAKFHQHAIAQPLGIALAGFRESHDFLCENVVCLIAAISEPKRYQSHFEREAHDTDRLRVELPLQVRSDRHLHLPLQAGAQRTLSHRRLDGAAVDDGGNIFSYRPGVCSLQHSYRMWLR